MTAPLCLLATICLTAPAVTDDPIAAASPPPPPPLALVLAMTPPVIALDRGQTLSAEQLLHRVGVRLGRSGVGLHQPGERLAAGVLVWRATLLPRGAAVELTLADPEGRILLRQRLATARRRANDVTHTLALSIVEAMAPRIAGLLREVPDTVTPAPASPDPVDAVVPVDLRAEVEPAPELPPSPPSLSLLSLIAGVASTTERPRLGLALAHTVALDAAFARGAVTLWRPRTAARAADYRVELLQLGARADAGLEHRRGDWLVGASFGPGLRLSRQTQSGPYIAPAAAWFASGSLGLMARGAWLWSAASALELDVGCERFYPHREFVVDGKAVISEGEFLCTAALGVGLVP